jgi:hypothetical protein
MAELIGVQRAKAAQKDPSLATPTIATDFGCKGLVGIVGYFRHAAVLGVMARISGRWRCRSLGTRIRIGIGRSWCNRLFVLEDFCAVVGLTMRTDVIDLPSPQDLREDFKAAQAFVERCDGQLLYFQGNVTDKAGLEKICADISEKEGRFE